MADMVCDNCGSTDPVVHLTQIVNNEISTHHLCDRCAGEKGLDNPPETHGMPLVDMIQKIPGDPFVDGESADVECSFCGLTYSGFRETGRLGCPNCYEAFAGQLPRILRRIHGSVKHVGKVYLPPDPTASEMENRLEGLRRGLHRAVRSEDFERAAKIRDEIRNLEPV